MNLAYKKILGKFTKVLGFGKTPPPCWENFPNNVVFSFWERTLCWFFYEADPSKWNWKEKFAPDCPLCRRLTHPDDWLFATQIWLLDHPLYKSLWDLIDPDHLRHKTWLWSDRRTTVALLSISLFTFSLKSASSLPVTYGISFIHNPNLLQIFWIISY